MKRLDPNRPGTRGNGVKSPSPLALEEGVKPTYKLLFTVLWQACGGCFDAVDTLLEDLEFAQAHPDKAYVQRKSAGLGEVFAEFRAKRALSYDDLHALRSIRDQIKALDLDLS